MMSKSTLFSLIFSLLLFAGSAYAQNGKPANNKAQEKKNKEEEKKWKQKMKATKPLDFKDMMNQRAELIGENEGLKRQISNMGKIVSDKDAEIEALRKELETAKASGGATMVRTEGNEIQGSGTNPEYAQGTWFRVQVGVYSKLDATMFKDNNKNFAVEQDSDGALKYTLGHFRDYWEADNFKKYLRKMGVKDAWIVAYKDNQRVNVKDVHQGKGGEDAPQE
jgi:hypothetical protein